MKHFESFESNRWIWRINLALQVVLVLVLGGIVNYIALHSFTRIDVTERGAFSLSPETLSYIHDLQAPVDVIVTFTPNSEDDEMDQVFREVSGILREYEYAARQNDPKGRVSVRFINVYKQRSEAERLEIKYPDSVVFRSGDRERIIMTDELYRSRERERSEFEGEKVFTSAMIEVASKDSPKIYFVTGHGELQLDGTDPLRGASRLNFELRERGYQTEVIQLSSRRRIPDDADMVIVLSPRTPFLPAERELLREYLANGRMREPGRVILALDPGREHGLEDVALDWGIQIDDDLVRETNPDYLAAGRDIFIRRFIPHPITQVFIDNGIYVFLGFARSVREDKGRPFDSTLEVTEILFTSNQSWGEMDYRSNTPPQYDPARDIPGPVTVAVVAQRKVESGLGVNIPGGRLVVFGSSDFLTNNRIAELGNNTLMLNAVKWTLDRGGRLNIPARPVERLKITLSEEQLAVTRITVLLGPAVLAAALGFLVMLRRRR